MALRDLFVDTLRTLWGHKLRTALTMFGIAWGIVSITLMVAAGEGLREGQRRRSEGFGKNILLVTAGRTSLHAGGTKAGRLIRYTDTDHLAVAEQSPDCQYVMPEMGRGGIPVRSRFNNGLPQVTGSLPPFAEIRSLTVGEGRYYNWEDESEVRRVVFLGTDVKKQLFGSRAAVGETVHIGDFPYAAAYDADLRQLTPAAVDRTRHAHRGAGRPGNDVHLRSATTAAGDPRPESVSTGSALTSVFMVIPT